MEHRSAAKYRVVQWATGNIGTSAMRAVIEHPGMALVGVHVHAEAKAGRDAGELCGLGPIGVRATRDIDEIVALKPDCVLYMPQGYDPGDLCRLLASGANIVTTRGEFLNPACVDPVLRERIEDACRRGGSSIHSTGSSPGFITEALPIVLTSLQRRLDGLTIGEFADLSQRPSPEMLFQVMGFGGAPRDFDERVLHHIRESFGPSLRLLGDALSLPLDSIEVGGEVATARSTTRIAAGVIEAGTVAAQRITVSGLRAGKPLLRFCANWYCTTDLDPAWSLAATGWHVSVEGDAPLEVDIRFAVPLERMAAVSPGYTAHHAVNAIPFVCAAAPGIRSSVELPQIVAALS